MNLEMLENDYSYFQTLLITGGSAGGNSLSSTEIFNPDMKDWRYAASLPSPRNGLLGAKIGNTVFVFGKIYDFILHLT